MDATRRPAHETTRSGFSIIGRRFPSPNSSNLRPGPTLLTHHRIAHNARTAHTHTHTHAPRSAAAQPARCECTCTHRHPDTGCESAQELSCKKQLTRGDPRAVAVAVAGQQSAHTHTAASRSRHTTGASHTSLMHTPRHRTTSQPLPPLPPEPIIGRVVARKKEGRSLTPCAKELSN